MEDLSYSVQQLKFLRNKYVQRDIIELNENTVIEIIKWLTNGLIDGQSDVREKCQELSKNGFVKFLNKAVILITPNSTHSNVRSYPFEFSDDGKLRMTIYITDPFSKDDNNPVGILCKVVVDTTTRYEVIEGTFNDELAATHIREELAAQKAGMGLIMSLVQEIGQEQPDLVPDSPEWKVAVSQAYFRSIIKAQIISVIGINAYLSLYEKEVLVSRITQDRVMKASNTGGKRNKRNPFYRYVVELPDNYQPRNFDINYVLKQWERPSHKRGVWVRVENAEKLKERSKGEILWDTLTVDGMVKIKRPISAQTCHRRKGNPTEEIGVKTYTS